MKDFKIVQIIAMTIVQIIAVIIAQIMSIRNVLIIAMEKGKSKILCCLGREARGAGASLWLRPRTVFF